MNTEILLNELKSEVGELAKGMLSKYKDEATADGHAFLDTIKDDLEKWVEMLVAGKISKDEFDSLVRGQKDLAEMKALKQLGLAKVQCDKFVNAIIDKTIVKCLGLI